MSINFCTISSNTLDSFCGNIRVKVLTNLIKEKYGPPVVIPGGGGSHPSAPGIGWHGPIPGTQPNIPRVPPRYEPERERDLPVYEQPWITVKIFNFLDMLQGEQTLDAAPQVEFVTVTNLDIDDSVISVNITELEM